MHLFIASFFFLALLPFQSLAQKIPLSEEHQQALKKQHVEVPSQYIQAEVFEGIKVQGTSGKLKDYAGKLILLNFWATWCTPCLKELPDMEKLYQRLKSQGLVVIAVAMGEDEKKIQAFLKKPQHDISFPIIADPDMKISQLYGVQNIPITYVVHPQQAMIGRAIGPREWADPEFVDVFSEILRQ